MSQPNRQAGPKATVVIWPPDPFAAIVCPEILPPHFEPAECSDLMRRDSIGRVIACSGAFLSEIALEAGTRLGLERISIPLALPLGDHIHAAH